MQYSPLASAHCSSNCISMTERMTADRLFLHDTKPLLNSSGRSHIWFCTDSEPFHDGRRAQRLPFNDLWLKTFELHSCLSALLQQRSAEVTLNVYVLCWLLTGAAVLFAWPHRQRRGKRKERTRVSSECWVHWEVQLNSNTWTYTHPWCTPLLSSLEPQSSKWRWVTRIGLDDKELETTTQTWMMDTYFQRSIVTLWYCYSNSSKGSEYFFHHWYILLISSSAC